MDFSVRPVGAIAAALRPPEPMAGKSAGAPRHFDEKPPAPLPTANVTLTSWFDRNGDGKIDNNTWVTGGDAFLPVASDVAATMNHVEEPAPPRPAPTPATRTDVAAGVYQRYGTPSGVPTTTTAVSAPGDHHSWSQR